MELDSAETEPEGTPSGELDQALSGLAREQEEILHGLLVEAARCSEMVGVLHEGPAASALQMRVTGLATAIMGLLKGWQVMGGSVRLEPPPAFSEPLPRIPSPEPVTLKRAARLLRSEDEERSVEPPSPERFVPDGEAPSIEMPDVSVAQEGLPSSVAIPTPTPTPSPSPAVARPAPKPRVPVERTEPDAAPDDTPQDPPGDWMPDLAHLIDEMPAASNPQDEMEVVQRVANSSFVRWAPYPRAVQRALVGNLACRLRHLQDNLGLGGSRMDGAFRSLTRFSKSFQPGWVNGLTRGRGPALESWNEEGRTWWVQLVATARGPCGAALHEQGAEGQNLIEEHLDLVRKWLGEWHGAPDVARPMCLEKTLHAISKALDGGVPHHNPDLCRLAGDVYDHLEVPRFRRLRQCIRDLEMAEREERGDAPSEPIPASWPWWSHTVGKKALIVSCDPSLEPPEQLEQAFGFAALATEVSPPEGALDHMRQRFSGGGPDLVLLLSTGRHDEVEREVVLACQECGVGWAHVAGGAGVSRTRMAIERYLQPDPQAL